MNLPVITIASQTQTKSRKLVEMAAIHVKAAATIAHDDLRYIGARDLQEIRINLYLALELLAVSTTEGMGGTDE